MPVQLRCESVRARALSRMVASDAARLLELIGLGAFELSILLVDDATMRGLNREHRGMDAATDVLSFPQLDAAELAQIPRCGRRGRAAKTALRADDGPPVALGDVVISVQTASRQARALGVTRPARVRTLLIHGLLHLLGYDHERSRACAARAAAAAASRARDPHRANCRDPNPVQAHRGADADTFHARLGGWRPRP